MFQITFYNFQMTFYECLNHIFNNAFSVFLIFLIVFVLESKNSKVPIKLVFLISSHIAPKVNLIGPKHLIQSYGLMYLVNLIRR